jgi:hypothetical protein
MSTDGMIWSKLKRPGAAFDFEDWRLAETEFEPNARPGSVLVMARKADFRDVLPDGFDIGSVFYPAYWSIEESFQTVSNDDDMALMSLDDNSRRFALAGHPDAVFRLAWIAIQWFGAEEEALRWLGRARYLLGGI